jgi:hypothetical protein
VMNEYTLEYLYGEENRYWLATVDNLKVDRTSECSVTDRKNDSWANRMREQRQGSWDVRNMTKLP